MAGCQPSSAGRPGPTGAHPVGLVLDRVARQDSRDFDDVLGQAGGSRPDWVALLAPTINEQVNQRELAGFVGTAASRRAYISS